MQGLFTRRLGPLPVWVWFIVFVLAVFLFLKFRGGTSKSSNVYDAENLTAQQATLIPWSTDVFINIPQNVSGQSTTQSSGKVGYGSIPARLRNYGRYIDTRRNEGPFPPGTGTPRPRVASVTYQVPPGTQPAQSAAFGRLLGYTSGVNTFRSQSLLSPN